MPGLRRDVTGFIAQRLAQEDACRNNAVTVGLLLELRRMRPVCSIENVECRQERGHRGAPGFDPGRQSLQIDNVCGAQHRFSLRRKKMPLEGGTLEHVPAKCAHFADKDMLQVIDLARFLRRFHFGGKRARSSGRKAKD
jgi:hypothetical protein